MEQVINILLDYLKHRDIKNKSIRKQDYDIAASARDSERLSTRSFYNLINNCEDNTYYWVKYDRFIKEWISLELCIDLNQTNSSDVIKKINRKNNLDKLDI
jgi:hypothetical protein